MVARVEIDGLSPSDLKALVVRLLSEVADLNAWWEQCEEIARLKGIERPPDIGPSGMEAATEAIMLDRLLARRHTNNPKC